MSRPTPGRSSPLLTASLGEILRDRISQATFVVVSVGVAFGYSILLPFSFTQRVSFDNWHYLDARSIVFSAAFGVAMGWLIALQVYAVRRVLRNRGGSIGGAGAAAALLPSLLCCTPIVPSVLGFVGVSGTSLIHTSGRVQYFFAHNQSLILGGSLGLLVIACVWSLRRIAAAQCAAGECTPDATHQVPAELNVSTTSPRDLARAGSSRVEGSK